MKITYNENPMAATIELDEHEKRELRNRIEIKELKELLYDTHFHLVDEYDGKYFDLAKARENVEPSYYYADDTPTCGLEKRVEELYQYALSEQTSSHAGDCTCFACSCTKCWFEGMLGIDTIKGLGKHEGHKIYAAFSREGMTVDRLIAEWEAAPPIVATKDWHEGHTDRWNAERAKALAWLKEYRTLVGTTTVTPVGVDRTL
jgi:hypothetical protein